MHVFVQALDHNRLLKIQVEPNELVKSLKSKINTELGGNEPEDLIDSLSYLGVKLSCHQPLSAYNIRESSLLYIGRSLIKPQYPQFGAFQQFPHFQLQYPHLAPQLFPQFQTQNFNNFQMPW
jgi:hypothetical protein